MRLAPFLAGFSDELVKIANFGAVAGGLAGYHFMPGGLKSKLIGGLMGAGIGNAVVGAAKTTKQQIWDEPRARERAELYGYMPQQMQDPRMIQ